MAATEMHSFINIGLTLASGPFFLNQYNGLIAVSVVQHNFPDNA